MEATPDTIFLGRALGVDMWLCFNHGADADKHREMVEAFAAATGEAE